MSKHKCDVFVVTDLVHDEIIGVYGLRFDAYFSAQRFALSVTSPEDENVIVKELNDSYNCVDNYCAIDNIVSIEKVKFFE